MHSGRIHSKVKIFIEEEGKEITEIIDIPVAELVEHGIGVFSVSEGKKGEKEIIYLIKDCDNTGLMSTLTVSKIGEANDINIKNLNDLITVSKKRKSKLPPVKLSKIEKNKIRFNHN